MKKPDRSLVHTAHCSLSEPGRPRTITVSVLTAAYLLLPVLALITGGAPPLWILINFPLILIAGATFAIPGAIVAATISGILMGPFLMSFIDFGTFIPPVSWLFRLLSFELFGLFTGAVFALLRHHSQLVNENTRRSMNAQKMEAIGELASGIAHDFNNVLSVIVSYSELALHSLDSPIKVRSNLTNVLDAAKKGASLSHQLLAFGRRQVLQPSLLNLNDVIHDLKTMLDRIAGDNITVSASVDPSLASISIDLSQLEQVIMNLAVNARDAITASGKILLATRNVELTANHPDFRPEILPGPYVQLTVSDTGVGMSQELATRAFEPFFTSKPHGTGLGLSTVYGIVKQSEGYIYLNTEEGKGTSFNLFFPAINVDSTLSLTVCDPTTKSRGRNNRVLLVEDEEETAALFESALLAHGYAVHAERNPEVALRSYKKSEAAVDLLVTDIALPGLDGLQLSRRLSADRPNLKTVFISGYAPRSDLPPIQPDGRSAILQKPCSSKDLLLAVQSLLEHAPKPNTPEPNPSFLDSSGPRNRTS